MFGFGKDNLPENSSRVLKALMVHEDVSLKNVEYQLLQNKYNAAVFTFNKLEAGVESILIEKLLEPTGGRPKVIKGTMETQEQANNRVARLFNAKLRHIAHGFQVTDTELAGINETSSFKEFVSNFAELISKTRDNTVNLKVILNSKGYPSLPTYPPFIEPSGEVTLQINQDELDHAKTLQDQDGVDDGTSTKSASLDDLL